MNSTSKQPQLQQQRRSASRMLQLAFLAVGVFCIVAMTYGFHLLGDDSLCTDRNSLKRKISDLQKQLHQHQIKRDIRKPSDPGSTLGYSATTVETNSTENTGFVASLSYDSKEAEQLSFRRSTRYWLETKPLWPKEPLPITDRYVTFDPWRGGFNNIRMSLEMAFAAAYAMNRTLVLPPTFRMYLRGTSSLQDYFDLDAIRRGVPTLTYDEFVDRLGLKKVNSQASSSSSTSRFFSEILSMPNTMVHGGPYWKDKIGSEVVYCVPHCPQQSMLRNGEKHKQQFFEKFAGHRYKINTDDPETEKARIVHFPKNLLGHFYTMFWFQDPQMGRKMKRLLRDHVHFREEIFALAERVVKKLGDFKFSCLHIRRNEFQFKDVWTPAPQIVENTKKLFNDGEQIYIATDEVSSGKEKANNWGDPLAMAVNKGHDWFKPMMDEWGIENVHFLNEFYDDLKAAGLKSIHIGCVESVVCSRARVFVGTQKSTFSGYIHRMRGYMHDVGQKELLDAQSKFPDDYYKPLQGPTWSLLPPGSYHASHPYWGREYKDVWENVYNPLF